MIFDLLTPHQATGGGGGKKSTVAHPIFVSNLHTKFGWILSNGLGEGQMDQLQFRDKYSCTTKFIATQISPVLVCCVPLCCMWYTKFGDWNHSTPI